MPNIYSPGHYDRSKFIADNQYDDFFKLLTEDDAVEFTGSTESPLGHVMLVHLDRGSIGAIMGEQEHPEMYSVPEVGWYNVRKDDNGLIWGIGYGPDSTFTEEGARADFAEAKQAHNDWCNFDEDGNYVGDDDTLDTLGCADFIEDGSCIHSECPNP
jgi:hypothetical protein